MNVFLIMVPLLIIRFAVLGFINKEAIARAFLFAPLNENEKLVYVLYQLSNTLIVLFPIFLKININTNLFFVGLLIYILGNLILLLSVINFAKPKQNGINTNGIYKISRNPMYIGYFIYFLGCVLLANSFLLFVFLMVFQISSHWIILSEERWCIEKFGDEYTNYMNNVRRYI